MLIKGHKIQLPYLWLGHDIKQGVRVWEYLPESIGIMLNAYHLTKRNWFVHRVTKTSLADTLGFTGPVFMDSGGFLLQKSDRYKMSPNTVMDIWHSVKPNLAAVLDIPLSPMDSNRQNAIRWRRTLQNTEYMQKNNGATELCPVIHTYSLAAVTRRCSQLCEIIPSPRVVCIGSLVPLIQGRYLGGRYSTREGQPSNIQRWRFIGRLIAKVRNAFPNSLIHVFGAGSLSTMYLLYSLGADSLDSTAWRLKAAYGEIQLPGTPNRWISGICNGSHTRKGLGNSDVDLLEQCDCPACSGKSLGQKIEGLRGCYKLRAIHNAFTFVSEVKLLQNAKAEGNLISIVQERLSYSPRFQKIFDDVVLMGKTIYCD